MMESSASRCDRCRSQQYPNATMVVRYHTVYDHWEWRGELSTGISNVLVWITVIHHSGVFATGDCCHMNLKIKTKSSCICRTSTSGVNIIYQSVRWHYLLQKCEPRLPVMMSQKPIKVCSRIVIERAVPRENIVHVMMMEVTMSFMRVQM